MQTAMVEAALWGGLYVIADPQCYRHISADAHDPHERAKAMAGLYLFQVEGLIDAHRRAVDKGICHVPSMVHAAWLRWLQLHGRNAHVIVPMTGTLAPLFPPTLLTTDEAVLRQIERTMALGVAPPGRPVLVGSGHFLVPAGLFATRFGDHRISNDIMELLGLDPVGSCTGAQIPSFAPIMRSIADEFASLLLR